MGDVGGAVEESEVLDARAADAHAAPGERELVVEAAGEEDVLGLDLAQGRVPEVLGDDFQGDAVVQPRAADVVVVGCHVAEIEAEVREILAFGGETSAVKGGWVVGEPAQLGHAADDADLRVTLVPEGVGDSQGEGGGMCAEFWTCF